MLSIIIPTLNEEKYLPLLLEEIKKQEVDENSFISTHRSARVFYGDLEIIVADADSEDKTVEIAKNYGCKIASGGLPAKGRNEGAGVANGDLFLFLDADVIFLPPQFLKNLLKEFENRNLGVASFPVYPRGNWFDKLAYSLYNVWVRLTQKFLPHATQSILVKKEIHQKINGFDEEIKIGEDHIYVRKANEFGKFGFINIEPVLSSARRFERDGRFKTYFKYLLAGVFMIFFGPVKSDIFKYRFDSGLKNKKKEVK